MKIVKKAKKKKMENAKNSPFSYSAEQLMV
jgi:hypothetical protein